MEVKCWENTEENLAVDHRIDRIVAKIWFLSCVVWVTEWMELVHWSDGWWLLGSQGDQLGLVIHASSRTLWKTPSSLWVFLWNSQTPTIQNQEHFRSLNNSSVIKEITTLFLLGHPQHLRILITEQLNQNHLKTISSLVWSNHQPA